MSDNTEATATQAASQATSSGAVRRPARAPRVHHRMRSDGYRAGGRATRRPARQRACLGPAGPRGFRATRVPGSAVERRRRKEERNACGRVRAVKRRLGEHGADVRREREVVRV
jgi:hypothetical protein